MSVERAGLLTAPAAIPRVVTRLSVPTLQRQCACGTHTSGDQECEECKGKNKGVLQRSAVATGPLHAPAIVTDVLRSPGQPLDGTTRAFMESHLGHDFSHVRVHTDTRASESAHAVGAAAYTVGRHVVLAAGRYAPGDSTGRRLLAHELTHVLQQSSVPHVADGSHSHWGSLRVAPDGSAAELEADRVANEAGVDGGPQRSAAAVGCSQVGVLQRQPVPQPQPPQAQQAGPAPEADPERERVLAAAQRTGSGLQSRAWEMTWRMLTRYFPEYVASVSGVAYQESQRGARVEARQIERNGQRSLSFTVIVGRWFVEQATDENLRERIEALRYSLAASRYPLETVRTAPESADPTAGPAVQSLEAIIRERFPLKRRRISRLSYDANLPGLRTEFSTVRLHVEQSRGGVRQWALDVTQSGPQLFFGRAFLAMQRADQITRLEPELARIDKWSVDNARITREDLQDEDIKLRIRGLSRAELVNLRDRVRDDEVRTYADSLTGTSTPLEAGLTRAPDGTARVQIGNVTVVVRPDQPGAAGVEGGETSFALSDRPAIPYRYDGRGRITEFQAPPAQTTITIQTRYGPGADPDAPSAYGRGTTERERAVGARSLRVHEGSHGLDYIEFIRTNPFPTFGGRVGMTRREFDAEIRAFDAARAEFHRRMEAFSQARTDCVGVTIDEFNRGRGRRVAARCRP